MSMYLLSVACGRHSGCSLVVTMVQDSQFYFCTPQKASAGMYSRCLSLTNLVCVLFDPAIPTSSFNLFFTPRACARGKVIGGVVVVVVVVVVSRKIALSRDLGT